MRKKLISFFESLFGLNEIQDAIALELEYKRNFKPQATSSYSLRGA